MQRRKEYKKAHGKKKFTHEEDQLIMSMYDKIGNKWKIIASRIPGRSARQCRERWRYYLSPSINRQEWSQEEDSLLMAKYELIGPKWATIAMCFMNRTDVDLKNRYNLLMRAERRKSKKTSGFNTIESSPNLSSDDDCYMQPKGRIFVEFPIPISRMFKIIC